MVIPPMCRWPIRGVGRVWSLVYPPFAFPPAATAPPFLCRPVGPAMVSQGSAGPRRDGGLGVKLPSTSYFFRPPGESSLFLSPRYFSPSLAHHSRRVISSTNAESHFRDRKDYEGGDEAWRDKWSREINSEMETDVRVYIQLTFPLTFQGTIIW